MIDLTDTTEKLYEQVANDLKERINRMEFGVEGRIPNFLTLARDYKVSMSTIKKSMQILNDEHVVISRVGKGTFVNKGATKFRGSLPGLTDVSSDKIGLLIRDIEGPYFSGIYKGLAETADLKRKQLILTVSRDIYQQEDALLRLMVDHNAAGLLVTTRRKSLFGISIYDKLVEARYPMVFLHEVYDSPAMIVDVDNYRGGWLVGEHLVRRGTTRFAIVVGEIGFRTDDLRLQGFMDALNEAGVNTVADVFVFRFSFGNEATAFDEGYKIGQSICFKDIGVDGVFLFNDMVAMGFQKAILERGYRIPQDIACVGFDNIERCSEARVPLTTVNVPRQEIGELAINKILESVVQRDNKPGQRFLIQPELVIRDSA
jgi:DNA-binding LacI/PurR family transcriptional regulator